MEKTHNRYPDVLPNPRTIVVLPEDNGDPRTCYINANLVRSPEGQPGRYIAAQGYAFVYSIVLILFFMKF